MSENSWASCACTPPDQRILKSAEYYDAGFAADMASANIFLHPVSVGPDSFHDEQAVILLSHCVILVCMQTLNSHFWERQSFEPQQYTPELALFPLVQAGLLARL